MRGVSFKPMPWLSVVTVICTAILVTLAVWQFQRLQWKTSLLEQVERAVTAPPITSLSDLRAAITADEAVDFRRVEIAVSPVADAQSKLVFYPQTGGIYWQGFTPVRGASGEAIIYAALDLVEDKDRETYAVRPTQKIIGYARFAHPLGKIEAKMKAKARPEQNRYFKFNQTGDWEKGLPQTAYFFDSYYLEHVIGAASAETLPIKRPKIRNNHFDYMLTWASFAIILLVIYAILHIRAGRLKWQDMPPKDKGPKA